jgi:hypothetical protein
MPADWPVPYATSATGDSVAFNYGLLVVKPSDTARASTTSATDDPHLTLAVLANTVYIVDGFLIVDGDSAGDLKMTFTAPSGATGNFQAAGGPAGYSGASGQVNQTAYAWGASAFTVGVLGAGSPTVVAVRGVCRTSSTAGSITLQWAQVASSLTATTVFTNSYLRAVRVA